MHALLQNLHRSLTLGILNFLLKNKSHQAHYKAVPQRLLYVPASSLPHLISGYTTRTHEILKSLDSLGTDLRILTRPGYPWDRQDKVCAVEADKTEVQGLTYQHVRHPTNNWPLALFAAMAAKTIANYAEKNKVTCIHAASNHTNALPALIAARRLGIPFQYEMRGLWELSRASRQPEFENSHNYNFGLKLEGLVAKMADRVFVISEELGRFAQSRWGIDKKKLFLLPNCVDSERVVPTHSEPPKPNTIGYAGSLIAYEGLDTLIHAVALIVSNGNPIQVEIIGDGEAKAGLEALTQELGLQSKVTFLGKMQPQEARAKLERSTLVCIPRKPFAVSKIVPPIKLAEAMALGKAVVIPDLPVFIDEAGTAPVFFFKSGDAENLAEVLQRALKQEDKLHERGMACRKYVQEHRQWKYFVDKITQY